VHPVEQGEKLPDTGAPNVVFAGLAGLSLFGVGIGALLRGRSRRRED